MRPLVGEYMGCVFMHSTASLFLLVLSIEPEIVRGQYLILRLCGTCSGLGLLGRFCL